MRSKGSRSQRALVDIDAQLRMIDRFLEGFDEAMFFSDPKTVYAVTRGLEIISEASRRLPDDMKARHPDIPWKQIAGAGNIYRHDYEFVDASDVWATVTQSLPQLKTVLIKERDSGA